MLAEITRLPFAIVSNPYYQSFEVTFSEKPAQKIIDALKSLKMRWNPKKRCWYGFHPENVIREAIQSASENTETPAGILTEGYLGATAFYGSKSHKHLYGADLSAAIRTDFKAAGVKGTVRCSTYSGGQSLTATLTASAADFVPFAEYLVSLDEVELWRNRYDFWIPELDRRISCDEYFALEGEERKRAFEALARYEYEAPQKYGICDKWLERYTNLFTPSFMQTVKKALAIVLSYRYDDSNGQVDYFDTNFYYDLKIKLK
ncbi:MAG: hypothetical protein DBY32_04620 [Phascolarctobacterium sp.]|nr:MAG: hypothetical protein DBY32_04620 [Phascolarctobacterium sp.]